MNFSKGTQHGFDLMPALFVVLFAFIAVAMVEFLASWPAAERGLLIFEKTCPIYAK
jgi:hypothetical protein